MICLQWETPRPESIEVEAPPDFSPLRELAWRPGGHGVIVSEPPGGGARYRVIRCALRDGAPVCL